MVKFFDVKLFDMNLMVYGLIWRLQRFDVKILTDVISLDIFCTSYKKIYACVVPTNIWRKSVGDYTSSLSLNWRYRTTHNCKYRVHYFALHLIIECDQIVHEKNINVGPNFVSLHLLFKCIYDNTLVHPENLMRSLSA